MPVPTSPPPPGDTYLNDAAIPDGVRLFRRIPPGRFTMKNGVAIPNSDCFKNSPDGTGTSVDVEEDGWTPDDALKGVSADFGLVSLTAAQVRALGLGVIRQKIPGNDHHATLQGPKSRSLLRALAKGALWVKMAGTLGPEES